MEKDSIPGNATIGKKIMFTKLDLKKKRNRCKIQLTQNTRCKKMVNTGLAMVWRCIKSIHLEAIFSLAICTLNLYVLKKTDNKIWTFDLKRGISKQENLRVNAISV